MDDPEVRIQRLNLWLAPALTFVFAGLAYSIGWPLWVVAAATAFGAGEIVYWLIGYRRAQRLLQARD